MVTLDREERLALLLRAALGGDAAAYEAFLKEAASLVRGLARKKLGNANQIDPEDIVQETLLALHLKRHTWREDAPVKPWLYAIARYKVVDAFRRRGRRVEVDIDDFADVLAAEETETLQAHELSRALDSLSDRQRQIVSSIGVDGNSIAETADAFGMKEPAVRVAFHRGLSALAAKFGKTP